jgi:chromosomal replication initiation ATPase DnaA
MEKEIINYFYERQHEAYTGIEVARIVRDMCKPKRKTLDLSHLSSDDIASLLRIVEAVEHVTGMHFDTFNTKSRKDEFVTARFLFMYLVRYEMKLNLKTIGRILGGRDHSTIIHGLDVTESWVTNPLFYKRENKLINDTTRHLESSKGGQG